MGKQGQTVPGDFTGRQAALLHAGEVSRELAQGRAVAPEAINRAADTFLHTLVSGPAPDGRADSGLVELYLHSPAESNAELLGKLVAAGKPARPVLGELALHEQKSSFSTDEIKALSSVLDAGPRERLETVSKWLEAERGHPWMEPADKTDKARVPLLPGEEAPPDFPYKGMPFKPLMPAVPGLLESMRLTEKSDPTGGEPPPEGEQKAEPSPEEMLRNAQHPANERLSAAVKLGKAAVPVLQELLAGDDAGQREFAYTALAHLGRDPKLSRAVYEAARRLESDPRLRPAAEALRADIEEPGGGRQQGQGDIGLPDGMLRAAIEGCDAPNILQAAAGRESLAIRLVMRKINERRAGKH